MSSGPRNSRDEATVPFKTKVAGNDLFHRAIEGEDPTLAAVLLDTLTLVGLAPEALTPEQLSQILPEVERRLRLMMDGDRSHTVILRLRGIVLGLEEE